MASNKQKLLWATSGSGKVKGGSAKLPQKQWVQGGRVADSAGCSGPTPDPKPAFPITGYPGPKPFRLLLYLPQEAGPSSSTGCSFGVTSAVGLGPQAEDETPQHRAPPPRAVGAPRLRRTLTSSSGATAEVAALRVHSRPHLVAAGLEPGPVGLHADPLVFSLSSSLGLSRGTRSPALRSGK